MTGNVTVLKFGGSLLSSAHGLLEEVREWGGNCLIVPGGGTFADAIREMQSLHGLSDETANWMAVAACEQYAYYLADVGGFDIIIEPVAPVGQAVFAPYVCMLERDPLPHGWGAASDCIAAWCARETGARFIKVTDVNGILMEGVTVEEIDASRLADLPPTCLDALLPGYLRDWGLNLFVVGGQRDALGAVLRGELSGATFIHGR